LSLPAELPQLSTLEDWLSRLETLHPKKIDLGLSRVQAVLDALQLRSPPYRVLTVAGTNGKGSCVAQLESIYLSAGYRVGAFMSPHLWRFNERIRFDGAEASDGELVDVFRRIEATRGSVSLSYFEFSAVAALLYFALREAQVAVLEVGMGGRLDAVNAIDADASLVASVGLDHQQWLGSDREAIGREKAGIFRGSRPAVVADPEPPASIIAHAAAVGADLRLLGRDFGFAAGDEGTWRFRGSGEEAATLPRPGFGGDVQLVNASACVEVVQSLQRSLPVGPAALARGLRRAVLHGRLEQFDVAGVEWIFDVAHNPAAARTLRDAVARRAPARRTRAVLGMMADKDIRGVIEPLVEQVDEWACVPIDSERGASPRDLSEALEALGARDVATALDIGSACTRVGAASCPGDRVLVFGSFYTVGPAMAALGLYCSLSERDDPSATWTGD
jgi:dihydrofolate synthase/folylpolyglutamate synthase